MDNTVTVSYPVSTWLSVPRGWELDVVTDVKNLSKSGSRQRRNGAVATLIHTAGDAMFS